MFVPPNSTNSVLIALLGLLGSLETLTLCILYEPVRNLLGGRPDH